MSGQYTATLDDLVRWAADKMVREPDLVIGDPAAPYLRRWWIIPRNDFQNVYLHEILRSDDDRALHDHPWQNTSFIVSGGYREVTPEGTFTRTAGDVIERQAVDSHRLELLDDQPCISLFMTGSTVREWGFHCPNGWRHWRDFVAAGHSGTVGVGCD